MTKLEIDPTVAFVDGLARAVIRVERCRACGRAQTLAPMICRHCGSADLDWEDTDGFGIVRAVTQVHRAPSEAFLGLVPYSLVLVELRSGSQIMGHGATGLSIGDWVSADFFLNGGDPIIRFVLLERLDHD